MTIEELDQLLERFYKGTCTAEEYASVNTLLDNYARQAGQRLDEQERRQLLTRISERMETELNGCSAGEHKAQNPVLPLRAVFYRWAGAAALVIISIGLYYLWKPINPRQSARKLAATAVVNPGNTSASLLLPDGKMVSLDSSLASSLKNIQVVGGRVFLMKSNGQRIDLERQPGLTLYSTLVTKRGQQAPEMLLADGTKVWLNAASSLRFPVRFSGAIREVELTGEAYFEVAKDEHHPFIVKSNGSRIRVMGTHFNVMSYAEEPATVATLLEGAIEIKHGADSAVLVPGQQGTVPLNGDIRVKAVDANRSIAWMKGKLPMDGMDVHAFLREVSRWYDVDIKYAGQIPPQSFSGNLNRNVPLKHILAALRANGVSCQLSNRTLIVSKLSNQN